MKIPLCKKFLLMPRNSELVGLGGNGSVPSGGFDGVFLWLLRSHPHFGDPDGHL